MSSRFASAEFEKIKRLNPFWSDWTCFYEVIKNRNLSKRTIRKYFDTTISREEYYKRERNCLIDFLHKAGKSVSQKKR